jgi:hypothetical protein
VATYESLLAFMCCFVPATLCFAISSLWAVEPIGADPALEDAKGVLWEIFFTALLPIYGALIFCAGAIRWHRRIIRGEPVNGLTLSPISGTNAYFWHGVLFLIFSMICLIPSVLFLALLPDALRFGDSDFWNKLASPERIQHLNFAQWAGFKLLGIAGFLVFLAFSARWQLSMPYIAVRRAKIGFLKSTERLVRPQGLVVALMFMAIIGMMLDVFVARLGHGAALVHESGETIVGVIGIVVNVLGWGLWLTILSVAYRDTAI